MRASGTASLTSFTLQGEIVIQTYHMLTLVINQHCAAPGNKASAVLS